MQQTISWDQSQNDKTRWCYVCLHAEQKQLLYIKDGPVDIDKIKDTVTSTRKYLQSEDIFAPACGAMYLN